MTPSTAIFRAKVAYRGPIQFLPSLGSDVWAHPARSPSLRVHF
jgi:hypothetical protein